jgi:hypothetical protein
MPPHARLRARVRGPLPAGTVPLPQIDAAPQLATAGLQDKLWLGNLDAVRDWGYAPEYVEGMWRMLRADSASDYVLATGHAMIIREFCLAAFARVDHDFPGGRCASTADGGQQATWAPPLLGGRQLRQDRRASAGCRAGSGSPGSCCGRLPLLLATPRLDGPVGGAPAGAVARYSP